MFIFWSILLGVGLAMDAFAVSIANSLNEKLKIKKMIIIALTYGIFQGVMPLIGYLFSRIFERYSTFVKMIPLIGFIILMWLGIKVILDAFKNEEDDENKDKLTIKILLIQALATSIDALSTGIGIDNTLDTRCQIEVYIGILIIVILTFIICLFGLLLGDKLSGKFEKKAKIFGGIILILIALKILIEFIIEII